MLNPPIIGSLSSMKNSSCETIPTSVLRDWASICATAKFVAARKKFIWILFYSIRLRQRKRNTILPAWLLDVSGIWHWMHHLATKAAFNFCLFMQWFDVDFQMVSPFKFTTACITNKFNVFIFIDNRVHCCKKSNTIQNNLIIRMLLLLLYLESYSPFFWHEYFICRANADGWKCFSQWLHWILILLWTDEICVCKWSFLLKDSPHPHTFFLSSFCFCKFIFIFPVAFTLESNTTLTILTFCNILKPLLSGSTHWK